MQQWIPKPMLAMNPSGSSESMVLNPNPITDSTRMANHHTDFLKVDIDDAMKIVGSSTMVGETDSGMKDSDVTLHGPCTRENATIPKVVDNVDHGSTSMHGPCTRGEFHNNVIEELSLESDV
ncbi:hypothetical protein ACH5RR_041042 [Cinchona calisaya]|uniref:Uncharacterized protein n=1 Tax=Cinchona calisaya TaxID=153742 RepID=A0ABD2XXU3_9GENT